CPLFYFLTPHPPRPTLFPYTTLFRSLHALEPQRAGERGPAHRRGVVQRAHGRNLQHEHVRHPDARAGGIDGGRSEPDLPLGDGEDRKSTRLNSSHVATSYAVFCLKKK